MEMKTIPMQTKQAREEKNWATNRRRRRRKCSNDGDFDDTTDKHVCSILLHVSIAYSNDDLGDRHILDTFLNTYNQTSRANNGKILEL